MRTWIWKTALSADIFVALFYFVDLVCQSGPGHWPSQVYAQSAVYPMAHSAAQVFLSLYLYFNFKPFRKLLYLFTCNPKLEANFN